MPATSAKKKVISPEIATKRDLKEKTKEVILSSNLAPRRDAPKCYNCQGTGHLARECPSERQERQERQDRPQRNYNQRSYGPKCYNCQQTGHMAKECDKQQAPKECYNCKKVGHISRDCPEGGDNKTDVECHKCHEVGHFARQCQSNFWIYLRLNDLIQSNLTRGSMIFHISIIRHFFFFYKFFN